MDRKSTIDLGPVRLGVKAKTSGGGPSLGAFARRLYDERRARDDLFAAALFAEPAWDFLLDLFALEQEGRGASVGGVAAAASIPLATADRFIRHLVAQDLVSCSPADARSWASLQLTDAGRAAMRRALGAILKARTH